MKKLLLIVLALSSIFASFESGMKMFGGSAGFTKDLEEDETNLYIAPKLGIFVNDNLLLEGGLTYHQWEDCWGSICDDENETVMSFGVRYFLDKIYFGAEYVPGITYTMSTPAGTSELVAVYDLSEQEMIIWKLGTMSSIAKNIYLDVGLCLRKYLDDDNDHDGFLKIAAGISYFWKD